MEIWYTPHFKRNAKKLPRVLRPLIEERLELFQKNPFQACLETHRLTGKLKEYWAFSINHRVRVMFSFAGKTKAVLHAIGNHDIYD